MMKFNTKPLGFIACLVMFICFANPASAQKRISLNARNMSLYEVFSYVDKESDYKVLYRNDEMKRYDNHKANFNAPSATAEEIIRLALTGTDLKYRIVDRTIVIGNATTPPDAGKVFATGRVTENNGTPFAGVIVKVKDTSNGVVTDQKGHFNLEIKDGKSNATLVISFLGYKSVERTWTPGTPDIVVALEETAHELDDFVKIGYMNVYKPDMVGANQMLKAEDVIMPSFQSIDQMLQGQIAGAIVSNSSIRAGSSPSITIRGTSTLLGSSQPLWVVDGVIQTDFIKWDEKMSILMNSGEDLNDIIGSEVSWLNPNDIESIVVLKDASSTSLYGSRASNGVIVITTKKGSKDRMSISYSGSVSVKPRPTYDDYNLMNSKERVQFSRDYLLLGISPSSKTPINQMNTYEGLANLYNKGNGDISFDEFYAGVSRLETVNTDWLKHLTQTAVTTQHNLSLSGGSEKVSYLVSGSFSNDKGIEIGSESNRYTGRVRLGFDLSPKVNLDVNMATTVTTTTGFNAGVSPLSYALATSRAIPLFDEDGSRLFYQKYGTYAYNSNATLSSGLKYNILNEIENTGTKIYNPKNNLSANLNWKINPDFTYVLTLAYSSDVKIMEGYAGENSYFINQNYRGFEPGEVTTETNDGRFLAALLPFGGMLNTQTTRAESYSVQNKLHFARTFNEKHRVTVMLGTEIIASNQYATFNTNWGYEKGRQGLYAPNYLTGQTDVFKPITGTAPRMGIYGELEGSAFYKRYDPARSFSAFLSATYAYNNRYVFNFGARNDASNSFGEAKRFNPTYSMGASWNVAEEPFMDNLRDYVGQFRVSLTYGVQGNALNNISPDLILFKPTINADYKERQALISKLPNPELSWESTKTWNLGLDMSFFNNLFNSTLAYYGKKTAAVMILETIPENGGGAGAGYKLPLNGAYIYNEGIDVTVNINVLQKKDMHFTVGLITSKNWNRLSSIADDQSVTNVGHYLSGTVNGIPVQANYPVGSFWRFSFKDLDPVTGVPRFNYIDKNAADYRGSDFTDFLVYGGTSQASITAGIRLMFRYKSLTLNASLAGNMGNTETTPNPYSNFTSADTENTSIQMPSPETNISKDVNNRWKSPADNGKTLLPSISPLSSKTVITPDGVSVRSYYNMWLNSDARLISGSFLRCREMSLSWRAQQSIVERIGLKGFSITASATNLFVIADKGWNGMDPEIKTAVAPKTFSLGINVMF